MLDRNSFSPFHPFTARGDRMKQAQTDADELIAAYRLEQQEAFDKAASVDGKRKCIREIFFSASEIIAPTSHHPLSFAQQVDPAMMPRQNFKLKQPKTFRRCRDDSLRMHKRQWMSYSQNVVKLVWRFLRRGFARLKSCMESKCQSYGEGYEGCLGKDICCSLFSVCADGK
jgi:hypothetical protein